MNDFAIDEMMEQVEGELVDDFAMIVDGEVSTIRQMHDDFNIAEWAVGELEKIDMAREAIKARAAEHLKSLLADLNNREKAIIWKYKQDIQSQVDGELRGKKRKSVSYATGKSGYRTVGGRDGIEVVDEDAAIKWAEENCPDAVKKSITKTALMDAIKKTGEEPPGVKLSKTPKEERFFIGPWTEPQKLLTVEPNHETATEFFGSDGFDGEL